MHSALKKAGRSTISITAFSTYFLTLFNSCNCLFKLYFNIREDKTAQKFSDKNVLLLTHCAYVPPSSHGWDAKYGPTIIFSHDAIFFLPVTHGPSFFAW